MFPRPRTKYSRKSVKARGTWHLEPTWQRNRHARVKGTDIHVSKEPPHILHILFLLVLIRLSLKLSLVWEPNKRLLPRPRNRPLYGFRTSASSTASQQHGDVSVLGKKSKMSGLTFRPSFSTSSSPCSSQQCLMKITMVNTKTTKNRRYGSSQFLHKKNNWCR